MINVVLNWENKLYTLTLNTGYLHIPPISGQYHQNWGQGKGRILYPRSCAQLDKIRIVRYRLDELLSKITYPLPASRSPSVARSYSLLLHTLLKRVVAGTNSYALSTIFLIFTVSIQGWPVLVLTYWFSRTTRRRTSNHPPFLSPYTTTVKHPHTIARCKNFKNFYFVFKTLKQVTFWHAHAHIHTQTHTHTHIQPYIHGQSVWHCIVCNISLQSLIMLL